jgi:S-formylglutathione hydrolase
MILNPASSLPIGLTCTEDTGAQKGGFLRDAAEKGIALVFPDTSPRGAGIQGEEDDWVRMTCKLHAHQLVCSYFCSRLQDFGTGAGFYLNATNDKWKKHYNMQVQSLESLYQANTNAALPIYREKYVTEELPGLIASSDLPIDTKNASIFGHSMGGHGALTLYLNHGGLYKSASAFAPICNPINAPWGKKAFAGPNGNDGYLAGGIEEGKKYDATEIIANKKGENINILVDSGTGDNL